MDVYAQCTATITGYINSLQQLHMVHIYSSKESIVEAAVFYAYGLGASQYIMVSTHTCTAINYFMIIIKLKSTLAKVYNLVV